jgi:hypothetical protein
MMQRSAELPVYANDFHNFQTYATKPPLTGRTLGRQKALSTLTCSVFCASDIEWAELDLSD